MKNVKFLGKKFPGGYIIENVQKLIKISNFANMYLLYSGNLCRLTIGFTNFYDFQVKKIHFYKSYFFSGGKYLKN